MSRAANFRAFLYPSLCALILAAMPLRGDPAEVSWATPAHDKPRSMSDFETSFVLSADQEGRIYKTRMDEKIFKKLKWPYRRDIAIFNSSGDVIPFSFVKEGYAPASRQAVSAEKFSAPLFELPAPERAPDGVVILTDDFGRVTGTRDNDTALSRGYRFLLDLSPFVDGGSERGSIAGYRIELPVSGADNTIASVTVSASDSLRNWDNPGEWKAICENAPLVYLRKGGSRVADGVIEAYDEGGSRYLQLEVKGRINVLSGDASITLLRYPELPAPPGGEASFDGMPGADGSIEYDTGGRYQADRINFILKSPGIFSVTVWSRNSREEGWRVRERRTLSYILTPGDSDRNEPFHVGGSADRFWRIEAEGGLTEPPLMKISWRPVEAAFLAQGKPPYILAVGNAWGGVSLESPNLILASSLVEDSDILTAEIGDEIPAYTPEEPEAERHKWQRYAMWAALTACAIVMSWIAWSLTRQSGKKRDDPGKEEQTIPPPHVGD